MGKNKNKLRTIYPKNHEIFKNRKTSVNFTGSNKKECILKTRYEIYELRK